jgi:hypothetical protein
VDQFRISRGNCISKAITDKYKTLSHIHVDATKVPCVPGMSPLGFPIFIQQFEVIYIYGGTAEIKAQLAWKEDVCVFSTCFLFDLLTKFSLFLQEVEKRYVSLVCDGSCN